VRVRPNQVPINATSPRVRGRFALEA
jgi:hypothetical protein